jgi:hypothetical protein
VSLVLATPLLGAANLEATTDPRALLLFGVIGSLLVKEEEVKLDTRRDILFTKTAKLRKNLLRTTLLTWYSCVTARNKKYV